jgi:hypothetical protein
MSTHVNINESQQNLILPHISWGAIAGGTLIAFTIFSLFTLLSSVIGIAVMDFENGISLTASTWATGSWLLASYSIAVGVGSYIAARLSGSVTRFSGVVSGLVVWSIISLLTVGSITNSIGFMASKSASAVASIVPNDYSAFEMLGEQIGMDDMSFKEVENSINEIEAPELKQAVRTEYTKIKSTVKNVVIAAAINPNQVEQGIQKVQAQLERSKNKMANLASEEKLKEVIEKNSDLSEQEVNRMARNWEMKVTQISQRLDTAIPRLRSEIRQAQEELTEQADIIKNEIAITLAVLFGVLLTGLIISGFVGSAGVSSAKVSIV